MKNNHTLDARDRRMLELLAEGASARVVARKMHYSEGTIRVYLHNLYKTIDFKKSIDDPANAAARKTIIKIFLNPNDPVQAVSDKYGATNYLFNAGTKASLTDNDGVFYQLSMRMRNRVTPPEIAPNVAPFLPPAIAPTAVAIPAVAAIINASRCQD